MVLLISRQASSDSHDVVEIPDDDVPAEEEVEATADISPVDVGQYTTKVGVMQGDMLGCLHFGKSMNDIVVLLGRLIVFIFLF